ncbi:MAG: hypothetical protein KGS47_03650 [Chloroflexi bacterium]|nr:hypothetical protein [Chloroflexota bacterium]
MTPNELIEAVGHSPALLVGYPAGIALALVALVLRWRAVPLQPAAPADHGMLAATWLALALSTPPPLAPLRYGADLLVILLLLEWPRWRVGGAGLGAALGAYPAVLLALACLATSGGGLMPAGAWVLPAAATPAQQACFWLGIAAWALALPGLVRNPAPVPAAPLHQALGLLRGAGHLVLAAAPWLGLIAAHEPPAPWLLPLPVGGLALWCAGAARAHPSVIAISERLAAALGIIALSGAGLWSLAERLGR